jgi:hypothetical protein
MRSKKSCGNIEIYHISRKLINGVVRQAELSNDAWKKKNKNKYCREMPMK